MRSFYITLHTVQEVQEFVSIATAQPFEIKVGNNDQWVNGKSLMGYFCLNPFSAMQVCMECGEDEYWRFYHEADKFCVKD